MALENYPRVYLYKRIVQTKLFMDSHYAEQIDLGSISDAGAFSKFHFIRLFKKTYGKTPHQYLISVRIEQAKELLKANTPVSDACYAVGFESLSSFSGLFKRTTGITPSAFLAQQQVLKTRMTATPLEFIPGCFASQHGWTEKSNSEEMTD